MLPVLRPKKRKRHLKKEVLVRHRVSITRHVQAQLLIHVHVNFVSLAGLQSEIPPVGILSCMKWQDAAFPLVRCERTGSPFVPSSTVQHCSAIQLEWLKQ